MIAKIPYLTLALGREAVFQSNILLFLLKPGTGIEDLRKTQKGKYNHHDEITLSPWRRYKQPSKSYTGRCYFAL